MPALRATTAPALVAWMAANGWTQGRLAERACVPRRTLYDWRTGRQPIPLVATRAFMWANDHTPRARRSGRVRRSSS